MELISQGIVYVNDGEELPYLCEYCGYTSPPYLVTDIDNEDGFLCPFCGKFCKQEDALDWFLV